MIQSGGVGRSTLDAPVRGGRFGSLLQLILHSLRVPLPALPGCPCLGCSCPQCSSVVLAFIFFLSDGVALSLIVSAFAQDVLLLAGSPLIILYYLGVLFFRPLLFSAFFISFLCSPRHSCPGPLAFIP